MLTERPGRGPIAFARRYAPVPVEVVPSPAATLATRFAAFVVDWVVCIVIVNSLVGALHVGGIPTPLIVLAAVCALLLYFTVFWARGRTPGMRVMGIVALDSETGRLPSLKQALYRAMMTVPSGTAAIILGLYVYVSALGQDPGDVMGIPASSRVAALLVIAVPYLVTAVLALRDPDRRMWHDRVGHVVVLEGVPPA